MENLWNFIVNLPTYQIAILCSVAYLFCGGLIAWVCVMSGYINNERARDWDLSLVSSGNLQAMVNVIFWSWPFFLVTSIIRLTFGIIFRFIFLPGLIYEKLKTRALQKKEERERLEALRRGEYKVTTNVDAVRVLDKEIKDKSCYHGAKCNVCGTTDWVGYIDDPKSKFIPGFYCYKCFSKKPEEV